MILLKNKLAIALLGLSLLQLPAQADNDHPITVEQLPTNAQALLKRHFSDFKVVYAEMEKEARNTSYEVKFSNGGSIEFDKNGEWKEIDCGTSAVPGKFIPKEISKRIHKKWPGTQIVKIEKDRKHFEVELSSGKEITFNSKFKITEVDD